MRSFVLVLFTALSLATIGASSARADGYYGPNPDYAPSVFSYAYRGLVTGALVGLAGGYLVARHDDFQSDDWRPLVLGAGIGAVSGAGLGLTLGFVDLADDRPGRGSIALRDTMYGATFGTLIGGIIGGLVIIRTHDAEHALFGAAIGTLAGTGLGLGIGLIEGARIVDSPRHRYSAKARYAPSVSATRDVSGGLVLLPSVGARF